MGMCGVFACWDGVTSSDIQLHVHVGHTSVHPNAYLTCINVYAKIPLGIHLDTL